MYKRQYLLFALFATAGLYFQLDYEFLGAVQIAVYAGGIVVLFVFSIPVSYTHLDVYKRQDIFWPDVPIWLKCPLPIMQVIEIFGIFTKPAALTVRLFANMMGGHMIVLILTMLIFIFAAMGVAVASVSYTHLACPGVGRGPLFLPREPRFADQHIH